MKASQLFARMPRPLALEILEFTLANDKEVYAAMVDMVAQARKIRPVFFQRQPRPERLKMIISALSRPASDLAAENLIRNWLLKKQTDLLRDFLDALQIPHDQGVVENLPESVEDPALNLAVDQLLQKHAQPVVAVYLNAFNSMNELRWPNLELLLECDERLELKPESQPAANQPG